MVSIVKMVVVVVVDDDDNDDDDDDDNADDNDSDKYDRDAGCKTFAKLFTFSCRIVDQFQPLDYRTNKSIRTKFV